MSESKPITIELAENGVFQIATSPGGLTKTRRIAKPIRLRAIGEREDGVTVAQIRFRTRRGHNLGEFFSWSDLLSENRKTIKNRLGGEEVRFMDIPASEPGSSGIFDGNIRLRPGKNRRETTKEFVETLRADAIKYQGHAIRALLQRYVNDQHGLEVLKSTSSSSSATQQYLMPTMRNYRVRSNFAVMYAAAALVIDYGILPWGKRATFRAIEKCMHLALEMLETGKAQAASPVQNIDLLHVAKTLKKHMTRAVILPVTPKQKVTADQARARRNADGFKIDGKIYVKPDRFKTWITAQSERDGLRAHRIIVTERRDTSTVERKIGGIIGKPRYYIIDLRCLDRLRGGNKTPHARILPTVTSFSNAVTTVEKSVIPFGQCNR